MTNKQRNSTRENYVVFLYNSNYSISKRLRGQFFLPCDCIRLNATHGIAKASPSVCPSVKRVDCDKMKEIYAHILIPHERPFILVF